MEQEILKVQMLGGFSISIGDKIGLLEGNRSNKAIYLLQYLLLNRKRGAPRDTLINLLYHDEDVENPGNALKIIIYRLRRILIEEGFPNLKYIYYKKGMYSWNNDIACEIDAETFEQAARAASDPEIDSKERILLYQKATEAYVGDFLPRSASEEWVSVLAVRFQNTYLDCIRGLYTLLSAAGDYQTMLDVLNKGVKIHPYNEELHILRITCLIELKHFQKAMEVFDETTELFFNELNIDPSEEMKRLYQKITESMHTSMDSLPDIMEILEEDGEKKGAYYCNNLTFIDSYRILLRTTERSGLSAFLMSCNLSGNKGAVLEDKKRLATAATGLHRAIRATLRQGDLYTRYSSSQFLILLLGIQQENCPAVFERIKKKFHEEYEGRGIKLQHKVAPAAAMQHEIANLKFSKSSLLW
jgi:DNA-binding SARP family transcriptional activator